MANPIDRAKCCKWQALLQQFSLGEAVAVPAHLQSVSKSELLALLVV